MAKTAKMKMDCGKVTIKLGPKAMKACRIAAKRANKLCSGNVRKEAAYYIASFARGKAASPDKQSEYTHGFVNCASQWGKLFFKLFSMSCYDATKPATKSQKDELNNDLDVLIFEMERLGIVKRWKNLLRWSNLVTPADRTVNDTATAAAECEAIQALFAVDEAPTVKTKKRKPKVCDECAMPLDLCICDEDEDDPDNDNDDPDNDND